MSKLLLKRILNTPDFCIGNLFLVGDGDLNKKLCDTLEDTVRPAGVKIQNKTAIPAGEYKVIYDFSNRFQKLMPHVLKLDNSDPDGFTGIRIHSGNTSADTDGCILVGTWDGKSPSIYNSKIIENYVMLILKPIFDTNKFIPLTIVNSFKEGQ
jgi:hypothetical protein